jgi:hypothetical protein
LHDLIFYRRDGGREIHIITARIWDGLKSPIPFILFGVSDFEFLKPAVSAPSRLSSWQVLLRGPLLFLGSGQMMLPLRSLSTRISLSTQRFST